MEKPSPFVAGLTGRCPKCGEGAMFKGLLEIAPSCDACGENFEGADIGDGAAVFALFIVGFLAIVLFLLMAVIFRGMPWWAHMIVQVPFIFGASILSLRPLKGLLFALQFKNDAQQGRLDD
ncbi:MAG: hypothetical protein ACI82N_000930 [Maricaulis sp.]|jgi:uncharacterized protein (DUF983 family)